MHAAIVVNSVSYHASGINAGFYRTLDNSAGFIVNVPFNVTRTGTPNFTDEIYTAPAAEMIHFFNPFNSIPVRLDWGGFARSHYSLSSSPVALEANIFGQKSAVHVSDVLESTITIDVTISGAPAELTYDTSGFMDFTNLDLYFIGELLVNDVVVQSWYSWDHPGEALPPSYMATLSPGNYVFKLRAIGGIIGDFLHSRLLLTAVPEASSLLLIGIASTIGLGWISRRTKR
jgi:hypothetical protein